MVHATIKDISWLRDHRGQAFSLNGADFARGLNYLGDKMFLVTIQSRIVRFSPACDMATQSMKKQQHLRFFCLALLYNVP